LQKAVIKGADIHQCSFAFGWASDCDAAKDSKRVGVLCGGRQRLLKDAEPRRRLCGQTADPDGGEHEAEPFQRARLRLH
jgi:hypothetical protein